ncbi:MAG TPA: pseudouridine synthase, partial [Polyangia bacterium]|nr:pseudouridine synthase [Polyangia bacterium]
NLGWSRTAARAALADGRVRLGGEAVADPRRDVAEDALPAVAVVDDAELALHGQVSLMLNKPTGCVTALRDPRHPTAYALLRGAPLFGELRPVGRLDLDTSGLLVWSTDGAEIQRLTHPKRAVPRTYQAALARPFAPLPAKLLLDDGHAPNVTALAELSPAAAHPSLSVPAETAALAGITIVGGAYHEVRRIFAALGSHVLGLCRVRFGDLELPRDLAPGAFRLLPGPGRS